MEPKKRAPRNKNKVNTAVTFSLHPDTVEKMEKFFESYCIDKSKFIEKMINQNIDIISQ